MKRQKKQLLLLLVVLLLGVGAFALLSFVNRQKDTGVQDTKITVCQIDPAEVVGFSVEAEDGSYHYTRQNEEWSCLESAELDLDEDKIETMLNNVKKLSASDRVENPTSLSDYGFDQPKIRITISTEQGDTTISVGGYNELLSLYYLNVDGTQEVYLMTGSLYTAFHKTPEDLEAAAETETETETGVESETETESKTEAETETVADPETEIESETETDPINETEMVTEAEPEDGTE